MLYVEHLYYCVSFLDRQIPRIILFMLMFNEARRLMLIMSEG